MLTAKTIEGLKPKKNPYYVWDKTQARGKGRLGVQVTPKGRKSFKFRYFVGGKPQFIDIGVFQPNKIKSNEGMTLVKARRIAEGYTRQVEQGLNPKSEIEKKINAQREQEIEEAKNASIKQLFESHRDHKKKNGKRNYQSDFEDAERFTYEYISPDTKAKDVTTEDLIPILGKMIERDAATKSNRVRSILHAAFNYGLKYDNDPANRTTVGRFGLAFNPVSAIPKQGWAEKVGDHYLEFEEVYELIYDMSYRYEDFRPDEQTRDIVKLCFYLGGQRPFEICNLKWCDLNEKDRTIEIPDYVSKTNKTHLVALTDTSLKLLLKHQDTKCSPYIFYNNRDVNKPKPTNTIAQAIGRYRNRTTIRYFTARDFRRTFKTLAGKLGISKENRDIVQGHALTDVSSKHYDRYDYLVEKREVMELWTKNLDEGVAQLTKEKLTQPVNE